MATSPRPAREQLSTQVPLQSGQRLRRPAILHKARLLHDGEVSLSLKRVDVINLFAEDFAKTRSCYQEILGLPLTFHNDSHAVFKIENVIVSLWDAPAALELIAPVELAKPEAGRDSC